MHASKKHVISSWGGGATILGSFSFLISQENEKRISCDSFFNFHFFSESRKMRNEFVYFSIFFIKDEKLSKNSTHFSFFNFPKKMKFEK